MISMDVDNRLDLEVIYNLVKDGDHVLDLGCGDGLFLLRLKQEKHAKVLGIERDFESVTRCISNGVPVIQRDLDADLDFANDAHFDLVVLSRTIQELRRPDELLPHMVRAGRRAAISVINFAHWRCRLQLLKGRMPRNSQIPYQWYDTPNIHHGTIADFRELCGRLGITIVEEVPIPGKFPLLTKWFPNLFAVGGVFVIEKR
ncbi:MAG: methionine biosynthesis protein MetW [Victivallaceae bacterium]|nr:methionine biosynthesis protein MetW [Victivallaceae bacterium]